MNHKSFESLTFKDDWMFKTVLSDRRNKHIVKGIAETCIKRKIKTIKQVRIESSKDPEYESHGVRFDVMFQGDDFYCVIEMQTYKENLPCRSKYYHDVMDLNHFKHGMSYQDMKHTYVIFLLNNDYLKGNRPIYTAKTMIQEDTTLKYDDKRTTIYINPKAYTKDKSINSLCGYLNTEAATNTLTKDIEQAIKNIKKSSYRRKQYMMWDSYIHDREETSRKKGMRAGIKAGKEEGRNEEKFSIAKNMLSNNYSETEISNMTGLSIAKIKTIKI